MMRVALLLFFLTSCFSFHFKTARNYKSVAVNLGNRNSFFGSKNPLASFLICIAVLAPPPVLQLRMETSLAVEEVSVPNAAFKTIS